MGSSPPPQYFGRQRSLHNILGGGNVADVILWRRRSVTISILLGTVAAWVVFQMSGYTFLSFVSNVLLLLLSILFVWAKAAGLLNRPPPPIPKLQLSEAVIKTAADFVYSHMNMVLSATYKIALGKDTNLFYRVAGCLWLISFVGGLTDFLTLGYTGLLAVLTIPVLYEKYESYVERYVNIACMELRHRYESYTKHLNKVKNWILEKKEKLG
ncbi:reticulon-like protein B12 [Dioscorea cayenensis subsp. rotundata]|uniref:Reticulon-like protein n=2 Tax=Dioscorea cayennensis subsp. rotundata TaxID=55577 RepID=A0AB40C892_DIOCR|nr:reticulon-like protein B12 [Dioscorea cayenensis subsp. rotundata]